MIDGYETFIPDGVGEENVLARYYQCARFYDADIVVRITADCPLIDPFWIDFCVNVLHWGHYDYVCNTPYCPDGLDVEVFTMEALEDAHRHATTPYDLEHVTPYIRRNRKIAEVTGVLKYDNIKLSIDTPEDLNRVRSLVCEQSL